MANNTIQYICSSCGAQAATWSGRCHVCGEWNTLEEQLSAASVAGAKGGKSLQPKSVKSLAAKDTLQRLKSGIGEVDLVLGGGFVPGSVNLIAGQPGIGKSTLLLQLASALGAKKPVL